MEVAAGRQVFFQTRWWHGGIMHVPGGSGITWTAGVLASAAVAVIPLTSDWFVGPLIYVGGSELNVPLWAGACVSIGGVSFFARGNVLRFACGFALGGLWVGGWMVDALASRVDDCAVGVDQRLVIQIERVQSLGPDARIEGRITSANLGNTQPGKGARVCAVEPGQRLRLYWRSAPELRGGERVAVTARVKPPIGFANPGGFDYERWLFGAGLDGTGYVRRGEVVTRGQTSWAAQYRYAATIKVGELDQLRHRGVMLAVATGMSGLVSAESWRTFRRTGTIHLMVISGLHVALVAGFGALIAGVALRLMPRLLLRIPVQHAAWIAGLALAAFYAAVAGWGAPVMRAWLMAAVGVLAWYLRNRMSPLGAWCAAALAAIALNPLGLFHQGVWLSFFVVLLLLLVLQPNRSRSRGGAVRWLLMLLCVQVLVTLGMMPMLAIWGLPMATSSAVANLMAVPVVSALVVPGSLIGVALVVFDSLGSGSLGVAILQVVDQVLAALMTWLGWFANSPVLWTAFMDSANYHGRIWLPWLALAAVGLLVTVCRGADAWPLAGVWCALLVPVDSTLR